MIYLLTETAIKLSDNFDVNREYDEPLLICPLENYKRKKVESVFNRINVHFNLHLIDSPVTVFFLWKTGTV